MAPIDVLLHALKRTEALPVVPVGLSACLSCTILSPGLAEHDTTPQGPLIQVTARLLSRLHLLPLRMETGETCASVCPDLCMCCDCCQRLFVAASEKYHSLVLCRTLLPCNQKKIFLHNHDHINLWQTLLETCAIHRLCLLFSFKGCVSNSGPKQMIIFWGISQQK